MSQLPSIDGVTAAEQSTKTFPNDLPVNGYTQPLTTTHATALSAYHIKVEDFVDRLRASVENFFPNSKYRYKEVHVLLLSWKDDDLGVVDEVVELEDVFRNDYGCRTVERWEIPSLRPYSNLEEKLYLFRKSYSSSDNLLILYYAGHGYLDYSRLWKWAAYRYIHPLEPSHNEDDQTESVCSDASHKSPSPTLDWYALQSGLEHAESDVLILLDSCASAGSSGGSKQLETQEGGTTELLAACGFETGAPGPGPHSFTNALIKELRDMSTLDFPFAVTMLHQRIVARLVDYSPQYSSVVPFASVLGSGQPPPERRATPVYISLGRDFRQKSIPLRSFHSTHTSGSPSTASSCSTEQSKAADTDDSQRDRTASAIKRLLGDNTAPKVLLAINLHGEHWQNVEHAFVDWLKDMPILAASINIEAVFHGLSTMILLSMPIAIWDLFPEHPSCSFVGFVQSSNLLPLPMSLFYSKQDYIAYAKNAIWKFDIWMFDIWLHILKRISNERLAWEPTNTFGTRIWFLLALSAMSLMPFTFYSKGPFFDKADPTSVNVVHSDTCEVSKFSCLLIIFLWVLTVFRLDNTEMLRFLSFSGSFQKHWKRDLWSVARTLTSILDHTFVIAMINVIDAVVSGIRLRKYAHADGVRWTLAHTRYAAMGGFAVQPPVPAITEAFGGHRTPKSLSPRALLQARQTGSLKTLPDISITQPGQPRNTWTGRLPVLGVAGFLIQSCIRWRKCLSITPLELIACLFGTYTVMTYTVLDNAIFSYSVPTIRSLRDEEHFQSKSEDGDNLRLYHGEWTRSGCASYIKESSHRHRQYRIDPVRYGVVLAGICLCLETLQTPIRSISPTAHTFSARILYTLIMLVISLITLVTSQRRFSWDFFLVILTTMAASPYLVSLLYVGYFQLFFVAFPEEDGHGAGWRVGLSLGGC